MRTISYPPQARTLAQGCWWEYTRAKGLLRHVVPPWPPPTWMSLGRAGKPPLLCSLSALDTVRFHLVTGAQRHLAVVTLQAPRTEEVPHISVFTDHM